MCNIPRFTRVNTVSVFYYFDNNINEILANYDINSNKWTIPELPQNEYYFYVIDKKFPIPDANTNEFIEIMNNVFATKNRYNQNDLESVTFKSQLCSQLDKYNNPLDNRTIFSNYDPLVVISLHLETEVQKVVVINIEWIYEKEIYWITAKPFLINKSLRTFNCIKITNDIGFGNWTCNIYLGTRFVKQHNFKIIKHDNTVPPNPAFLNIKI
jgi:hypothetical protein